MDALAVGFLLDGIITRVTTVLFIVCSLHLGRSEPRTNRRRRNIIPVLHSSVEWFGIEFPNFFFLASREIKGVKDRKSIS